MTLKYRTVETTRHETGVGQSDRTETEHQLGAEIEGVFVPFLTLSAESVEVRQRAESERVAAAAEAASQSKGTKAGTGA
jgi:hypothetical protein